MDSALGELRIQMTYMMDDIEVRIQCLRFIVALSCLLLSLAEPPDLFSTLFAIVCRLIHLQPLFFVLCSSPPVSFP